MVKLKLVNFEQAKALMKLGYPQVSADYSYSASGDELVRFVDAEDYVISAPSLELVNKWLIDDKSIFIHIDLDFKDGQYKVEVCLFNGMTCHVGCFKERDDALSAGIDKSIKILKEHEN